MSVAGDLRKAAMFYGKPVGTGLLRIAASELDRLAADRAHVVAERDALRKEVQLVHAYKDAAFALIPEDDIHQYFVRVKEIRASRGLPS